MTPPGPLAAGKPSVLDGGTGSELRVRGIELPPACWSAAANLDHGATLTAIHRDYIDAGADIVTANTFATTRFVLAGAGFDAQFEAINRGAIEAARAAIDTAQRPVTLAASLSCLPPRFDPGAWPRPEVEFRAYAELADFFAANGVELVLLEMLQQPAHAVRVCRAVAATGLPFTVGLSCRLERDGSARRMPGPEPLQAPTPGSSLVAFDHPDSGFDALLDSVLGFDPAAIAVMHSPLEAMQPALERVRVRWPGPLAAYAEIPYAEDPESGHVGPGISPAEYALKARGWLAAGATIIGGCCGTRPAHIAALKALGDG